MSASLFDFGVYFFNNAKELIERRKGPYFYLPKMESHLEARLWNDVFNLSQDTLQIPRGTIRATVLIETILAAFEMEEIIYELRQHSSGYNMFIHVTLDLIAAAGIIFSLSLKSLSMTQNSSFLIEAKLE